MYQGKFDQNNKKSQVSIEELLQQRNSAVAAREAKRKAAADRKPVAPVKKAAPVAEPAKKAPVKKAAPAAPQKKAAPVRKEKGPRMGSMVFYACFCAYVLVFYAATYVGLLWLRGWLVDYESSRPTLKSQEIFETYFGDPDWGELYEAAAVTDTVYEGKDAFVSYMENKVGDSELTFMATSTGLSKDKKYVVRLGNEKLATFTLVDQNQAQAETDIPDWRLGKIQFLSQKGGVYQIRMPQGYTASVNGIALDDSNTISISTMLADEYLPSNVRSTPIVTQQVEGLIAVPNVTVQDSSGRAVDVEFDEDSHTFIARTADSTISEDERKLALNALETQCKYSITTAVTDAHLAKYFLRGTDTFKSFTAMDRNWLQTPKDYGFSDEQVTDMYRYTDYLYSVRVSLTMTQTRGDGSVKETDIQRSLFFQKQESGKWLCIQMTAEDVSELISQVRLTFMQDDKVLSSEFYAADTAQLTCPVVTAPEGKVFSGWVIEQINAAGDTVMRLVFQPDESGAVNLPAGAKLEPMTLYPLFEDAQASE